MIPRAFVTIAGSRIVGDGPRLPGWIPGIRCEPIAGRFARLLANWLRRGRVQPLRAMGIQILHNLEAGKIKIRDAGDRQREAGLAPQ